MQDSLQKFLQSHNGMKGKMFRKSTIKLQGIWKKAKILFLVLCVLLQRRIMHCNKFIYPNICAEILPRIEQLSGRASDYQSRGPGFKSWWGHENLTSQKFYRLGFYILVIWGPQGVYFEVWRVFLLANYFLFKSVWPWCDQNIFLDKCKNMRIDLTKTGNKFNLACCDLETLHTTAKQI